LGALKKFGLKKRAFGGAPKFVSVEWRGLNILFSQAHRGQPFSPAGDGVCLLIIPSLKPVIFSVKIGISLMVA